MLEEGGLLSCTALESSWVTLGGTVVVRGRRAVVALERGVLSEGAESVAGAPPLALTPEGLPATRPRTLTYEPAAVSARTVAMGQASVKYLNVPTHISYVS